MGVNANFTADFSTFLSAINAADVAMADFGKGADTVGTKLNNMVDKFSGRALIQQANELVVAINAVGGATTLTTNEQAKLNATLDQAIQKYQAIGEDVPPAMQKLADETRQVDSGMSDMMSTLGDVAGAFGIAFSVGAVVSFAEEILNTSKELRNLSLQTGINVEDLQVLKDATAEFGVEGDQLGRALFQLQQRIAGGDQSITAAYAAMGLSMDQVKAKSNDAMALFLMTEHGLGDLSGALQDVAAKDLFGGRLGASMIAFSSQTDEAIAKARALNTVASTESVQQMAAYSDAIDRVKNSMLAMATEGAAKTIIGIQNIGQALDAGATKLGSWLAAFSDAVTLGHADAVARFNATVDQSTTSTTAATTATKADTQAHTDAKPVLDAEAAARQYMATMEINNIAPLTAWQKQDLDYLNKKGELDKANLQFLGISVDQMAAYKKGLEDAKKASEDLSKQEAQADAIAMAAYTKRAKAIADLTQANLKAYDFEGQIANLKALEAQEDALARSVYDQTASEKDRMKIIEDNYKEHQAIELQIQALEQQHAKVVNDQVVAELDARQKVLAAQNLNIDGTYGEISAAQKETIALDALHASKKAGIDQSYEEQLIHNQYIIDAQAEVDALGKNTTATDANTTAKRNNAAASAAAAAAAAAVPAPSKAPTPTATTPSAGPTSTGGSGAVEGFSPGGQISSQYQLVGTDIWGMSAQAAAAGGRLAWDDYGNPYIYIPGVNAAPKVGSGPGVDLVLNGPGISVSGFADGGSVSSGTPIIVGERGPELFVPSSSGSIIPNGGGVSVTANIYVNGTAADVARQVAAELLRTIKSGAQLAH